MIPLRLIKPALCGLFYRRRLQVSAASAMPDTGVDFVYEKLPSRGPE
ncbi:hypothetical protein [Serratia ficaria]|nr:hypothetical protein [Serratia ficaria]